MKPDETKQLIYEIFLAKQFQKFSIVNIGIMMSVGLFLLAAVFVAIHLII